MHEAKEKSLKKQKKAVRQRKAAANVNFSNNIERRGYRWNSEKKKKNLIKQIRKKYFSAYVQYPKNYVHYC